MKRQHPRAPALRTVPGCGVRVEKREWREMLDSDLTLLLEHVQNISELVFQQVSLRFHHENQNRARPALSVIHHGWISG